MAALDQLQGLSKLQQLTLSHNPVAAKEVRWKFVRVGGFPADRVCTF
jgi:hypothetical protein